MTKRENCIRPHGPALRHLVIAAAALAVLGGGAVPADAATLRPNVVVHGDTVRLRDIFDDAGTKADTVLFRAPAPGQSVVLPSRWLHKVARSYGVDWQPLPGLTESRVERSSNRVGPDRIADALKRALERRTGTAGQIDVTLDNPGLEINLPVQQPADVIVKSLHFDPRSNRFAAVIMAPDDRPDAVSMQVAGRVHPLVAVPVLANRLRRGDIVGRKDLEIQMRRADALDRNAITSADRIVGMSARHTLRGGAPVGVNDIREPQLVSRGSLVLMTYRTANMSITAHGTARDNGTKGDTVRVRNSNSGKIIEAVVTGPDRVSVMPLTPSSKR